MGYSTFQKDYNLQSLWITLYWFKITYNLMMIMPDLSHITVFRSEFTFFHQSTPRHGFSFTIVPNLETATQTPKWYLRSEKTKKNNFKLNFPVPFCIAMHCNDYTCNDCNDKPWFRQMNWQSLIIDACFMFFPLSFVSAQIEFFL